ncbi:GNAT family N-acetyltransferase [Luteithermobacter gelatinilyticus]|uniref:GNAT family N-acetyltransferase n=1 Tax=Luteithermobacter gelatinilyticus TaxID=2582913 RepID=UPI0011068E85|nr:GNAT family N-acetyltransferase [Luteithermobacter gelatinilyticus]
MKQSAVQIEEVTTKQQLNSFIRLPHMVFADDPQWVAPLEMERRDILNRDKNPFFEHARARYWIARRGGEVVGRISAQIDDLVPKYHGKRIGHFGFFDCIEDQAVAAALFETAEAWLRDQGMTKIIGPFSLSINEETGMLVDGYHRPPMLMMPYSRPYYQTLVTAAGYRKVKDVWAYWLDITQEILPPAIDKLVKRVLANDRITIRPINMKQYDRDLRIILDIYNDAWSQNWGFLPFTEKELQQAVKDLKLLIREDFTYIAELDGEAQAMMVTLPNLNEIIHDLNGRLLPTGIFKLLWRLKLRPSYKTVRVPLMGVRHQHQNSALGGAMAFSLIETCRIHAVAAGCTHAELGWVLEENTRLQKMLETIGCQHDKTYRLFEKDLTPEKSTVS